MDQREEYQEMTNDEYIEEIGELLSNIGDNRLIRYFYIFISEKIKRGM